MEKEEEDYRPAEEMAEWSPASKALAERAYSAVGTKMRSTAPLKVQTLKDEKRHIVGLLRLLKQAHNSEAFGSRNATLSSLTKDNPRPANMTYSEWFAKVDNDIDQKLVTVTAEDVRNLASWRGATRGHRERMGGVASMGGLTAQAMRTSLLELEAQEQAEAHQENDEARPVGAGANAAQARMEQLEQALDLLGKGNNNSNNNNNSGGGGKGGGGKSHVRNDSTKQKGGGKKWVSDEEHAKTLQCHKCKGWGHRIRDCPLWADQGSR